MNRAFLHLDSKLDQSMESFSNLFFAQLNFNKIQKKKKKKRKEQYQYATDL